MLWNGTRVTRYSIGSTFLTLPALELLEPVKDLLLGGFQDAIESAQDGQGQHHIFVLVWPVGPAQQVGHRPDEADFVAEVVHDLSPGLGATARAFFQPGINGALVKPPVLADLLAGHFSAWASL